MTETTYTMPDPFDEADNAKPRPFEYYGQVRADAQNLYFAGNGAKPVPFDPTMHPEDKRRVEVYLQIIPIPEQNISYDVYQRLLSFDRDWTTITNPSIREIGVDGLRGLNNKWVRLVRVEGTRKKLDRETGEDTGEKWQTFKFLELYPDMDSCIAAFAGRGNGNGAALDTEEKQPADAGANEKMTALSFAKVLVANEGRNNRGNRAAFEEALMKQIAQMPLISKVFSITSPEIVELIDEEVKRWTSQ
ncbi:MAG: hypothetical protein AAGU15_08865 [Anaerolineaceae bacterium]